jgi:hypothetical protein
MRRLWIVLAVVFATSLYAAAGVQAATTGTTKYKARHHLTAKQKVMAAKWMKHHKKMAMAARRARGPMWKSRLVKRHMVKRYMLMKRHAKAAGFARGPKWRCYRVKRFVRHARPARVARGPIVTCPAPVVNVPQQPAPVVNVPQQAAPVVNVPAFPPTVGITVDTCNIYIVQGNQLMILDKTTYALKQTVPLQGGASP